MNLYKSFDTVIYRTPLMSYKFILKLYGDETYIETILLNEEFKEAIYLASFTLYEDIFIKKRIDKSTIKAIHKYFIRMCSRPTPFGLFAGCGVGFLTDKENKIEIESYKINRKTRLDMDLLCELANVLNTEFKYSLIYYPNSTGYSVGSFYRYIEYKYENDKRQYRLSSVLLDEVLSQILTFSKEGKTIQELVDFIENKDIRNSQKKKFINSLIENQLLQSELEPIISGREFMSVLTEKVKKLGKNTKNINSWERLINEILDVLNLIDSQAEFRIERYNEIKKILKQAVIPFRVDRLFQTDIYFLDSTVLKQKQVADIVLNGIEILSKLSSQQDDTLRAFKDAFSEKYDRQFVPLGEVLDSEFGISFPQLKMFGTVESSQIINQIDYKSKGRSRSNVNTNVEKLWVSKYEQAIRNNACEIEISDEDVIHFSSKVSKMSPTFSVITSNVNISDKEYIILTEVGCSTGINLLGRFCFANPEIKSLAMNIAQKEKEYYKNAIIAEIVHLPEKRVGNILSRPSFFDYEIDYLSGSCIEPSKQITITDLSVGVIDDEIILFSTKFKRRVIPRLSNAHNFSNDSLPVYNFLCSVQHQGIKSLFIEMGDWEKYVTYTPRIRYKNVILKLAKWVLYKNHLEIIKIDSLVIFCKNWKIPQYVSITDGDNELVIDTLSSIGQDLLLDNLKNNEKTILTEWLHFSDKPTLTKLGEPFVNQTIFAFYKTAEGPKSTYTSTSNIKKQFIPGSEWLYIKIYCGTQIADLLLLKITEIVTDWVGQEIEKWFFVRFNDPHHHLRIRFFVNNEQDRAALIEKINQKLELLKDYLPFWKVQHDSYERELERYGIENIELSETLFFIDSSIYSEILVKLGSFDDSSRWYLGIYHVHNWLDLFGYKLEDKLLLVEKLRENFANEFINDSSIKEKLSSLYRTERSIIDKIASGEGEALLPHRGVKSVFKKYRSLLNKSKWFKRVKKSDDLVASYLHMSINRWHISNQRLNEYIIYDVLFRSYRSLTKRNSVNIKAKD